VPNYTTSRNHIIGQDRLNSRLLTNVFLIPLVVGMLFMVSCSDDDFEGADVLELENRTFVFTDARAFSSSLNSLPATLTIGTFGDGALSDDESTFVLESNGVVAEGIIDLDEGDNPVGRDFSRCDFDITVSNFTAAGLLVGDGIETDCVVTEDDQSLRLTDRDTGQVSTGQLQQ
jgi:hypothetical protein